jgi:hypothetical protein
MSCIYDHNLTRRLFLSSLQDRPVVHGAHNSTNGNNGGGKTQEATDPTRRKYQMYSDAFEHCLDQLGLDVRALLRNARTDNNTSNTSNTSSTTTTSNHSSHSSHSNNHNSGGGGPSSPPLSLVNVCQQLSSQLMYKEQLVQHQTQTYVKSLLYTLVVLVV